MPYAIGNLIGDYEVIGTLGAGGIGQVYQVRHTISHRVEAMKVLLPNRLGADAVGDRFLREIRVLASLDHPNIAALRTAFHHQGELVMIMEFVEGQTLRAKMDSSTLTLGLSIEYAKQVLTGLAYAHGLGVIHRDIKPSNIIITAAERAKLLDFGLAFDGRATDLTRTGLILGSLHYMSPEQVMGERVDARSDVYAVGVTLYRLLTGRHPIDGPSEYAIASSHLRDTPPNPCSINPNISAELSHIVLKALAKAPADRFATAQDFHDALAHIQAGETMTLVSVPGLLPEHHHAAVQSGVTPPGGRSSKTLSGASVLSSVIRELAHYIGPIAKVVVNRAARQAATLDELYASVAPEITSDADRKAFLATRNKYSVQDA